MDQKEHAVFFRNACKMTIVFSISILIIQWYNHNADMLSIKMAREAAFHPSEYSAIPHCSKKYPPISSGSVWIY